MSQLSLTLPQARVRRDIGIQRATDHADQEHPRWADAAFDVLKSAVAIREQPFLAEDAIEAIGHAVPEPPDGRAWGGVFQRAARAGVIRKVGYAPARSSNLSPKVLWSRA